MKEQLLSKIRYSKVTSSKIVNYQLLTANWIKSRDDGIEVTLLPIPNRTVKVYYADGTAWETMWESRKLRGKMAR